MDKFAVILTIHSLPIIDHPFIVNMGKVYRVPEGMENHAQKVLKKHDILKHPGCMVLVTDKETILNNNLDIFAEEEFDFKNTLELPKE